MKRILLVLGVALALAGCGGGGGGGSVIPPGPNPPGPTTGPTTGPSPTPLPTATNAPTTVVVAATSSPFAIKKTAINPLSTPATDGTITVTGQGMPAGAALYATVTDGDKSGGTCLQLIPQGQTSGTGCQASVGVTHSGDQVAVLYNNGPTPPAGSFNITVTANGGTGPLAPFSMNYPAPAIGATGNGSQTPWGGGVALLNNNIYFTRNSASSPLGAVSYANGTVGGTVTDVNASPALTNAPAGGLVAVNGVLYGTEQNSTRAFSINPSNGSTTEYALTCPSSGTAGTGSQLQYPQTGITTDGSNVFVLCGEVATRSDTTHNTVNEISPTGSVSSCALSSAGGTTAGPFANGAVYSNGVIYSETSFGSGGGGAAGATGGDWIAIPVSPLSNCGHFQEMSNSAITGSGNVWMLGSNLYSETDSLTAAPSGAGFGAATVASPTFANGGLNLQAGGGGLAMDTVLGSGFFVGSADAVDAIVQTKWTGGTQIIPNTYLALGSTGTPIAAGQCEVAYNAGGGIGMIQLPDGKFAWPHATDGDGKAANQNWLCILNP